MDVNRKSGLKTEIRFLVLKTGFQIFFENQFSCQKCPNAGKIFLKR